LKKGSGGEDGLCLLLHHCRSPPSPSMAAGEAPLVSVDSMEQMQRPCLTCQGFPCPAAGASSGGRRRPV
jgi:hypothetical protein